MAQGRTRLNDSTNRLEAASRLIRSEGNLQLWATPRGEIWMLQGTAHDEFVVIAEQEMRFYGSGPTGIQSGDIVIDCGASIGGFTRTALDMGASLVVAVEPAPEATTCLERNFRREIEYGKVRIYPKGVWNREDILSFHGAGTGAGFLGPPSPMDRSIRVTTVDKLVEELNLDRVDFLKMDIEGAEVQALEGARQTLIRFRPRLAISTEHSPGQVKEVKEVIRSIVPSYVPVCGPCSYLNGYLRPDVLYFQ